MLFHIATRFDGLSLGPLRIALTTIWGGGIALQVAHVGIEVLGIQFGVRRERIV